MSDNPKCSKCNREVWAGLSGLCYEHEKERLGMVYDAKKRKFVAKEKP
jgi:hypothetical protein